jgi:hypothetical protein
MTWGFSRYGERGRGLVSCILGKPGILKAGQAVIISDLGCLCPRAYIHHHKKHEKPGGWTKQGTFKVKRIIADVQRMVSGYGDSDGGEDNDTIMYLWDDLPHFTWDDYFSGDQIFDYMGNLGFDALMMCR